MVELRGYARAGVGDAARASARDEGNGYVVARAQELIAYRSLIRNLVTKDLKVRYKNSFLGFLWSLLNPLLMMVIYTFVFTTLLKQPIEKFQVFVLAGLLPWNWCARSLSLCTTSLIDNSTIINKVYFPRVLLPVSAVASEAVNFLLALPAMFLLIVIFQVPIKPWIAYLPVLFVIQGIFLVGLGLILAGLNVLFRDTGVILEVALMAWFFLTPIFYDAKILVPMQADWMFRLNPMASIIERYRQILYWPEGRPDFLFDLRTAATCLVILAIGYVFFTSLNRRLGEHL
jgi:lipopolysaccharide transport system permease protein